MERRLLKQITTPAMLVALLFGSLLIMTPGAVDWSAGWWHAKLAGVVLMLGSTVPARHGVRTSWPTATGVRSASTGWRTSCRRC